LTRLSEGPSISPQSLAYAATPLDQDAAFSDFTIPFRLEHSRNSKFTGRYGILKKIQERLRSEIGHSELKIVALYGPGGAGKTQIAIEYAHLHHKNYTSIFWVDGSSQWAARQSFLQIADQIIDHYSKIEPGAASYRQLVARLGLIDMVDEKGRISVTHGQSHAVVKAIKNWFAEERNNDWLLIFDNVDDLDAFDVREFFPNAPWGNILVTSRRRDVSAFWNGIEVSEMNEEEGLRLLTKSINLDRKLNDGGEFLHVRTRRYF
jgi:hypothetical protein